MGVELRRPVTNLLYQVGPMRGFPNDQLCPSKFGEMVPNLALDLKCSIVILWQ